MAELETNPNRPGLQTSSSYCCSRRCPQTEINALARWEFVDRRAPLADGCLCRNLAKARTSPLSDAAPDVFCGPCPASLKSPWLFWNPNTGRPQDSIHHGWDTNPAAGRHSRTYGCQTTCVIPSASFLVPTRGGHTYMR